MAIFKAPKITTAQRVGLLLQESELVYDVDEKVFYYGDGETVGGIAFGSRSFTRIPEYDIDPVDAEPESAWVKKDLITSEILTNSLLHFGMTSQDEEYKLKYKNKAGNVLSIKFNS